MADAQRAEPSSSCLLGKVVRLRIFSNTPILPINIIGFLRPTINTAQSYGLTNPFSSFESSVESHHWTQPYFGQLHRYCGSHRLLTHTIVSITIRIKGILRSCSTSRSRALPFLVVSLEQACQLLAALSTLLRNYLGPTGPLPRGAILTEYHKLLSLILCYPLLSS